MKMSGFSLIEIMITSFILALGVLGLAGMQSTSMKSALEIQQRSLANSLIAEISERMQLNHRWLQQAENNYSITSLINADLSLPSCIKTGGVFDNCSGEEVKENDLYQWKNKLLGAHSVSESGVSSGLIDADACIEEDSEGRTVIVLSWNSTIKSQDAAAGHASTDLTSQCGVASAFRRQLTAKIYTGKSV